MPVIEFTRINFDNYRDGMLLDARAYREGWVFFRSIIDEKSMQCFLQKGASF
jgi:hypothetical protein